MNIERDKFLTEAMGIIWHDFHWNDGSWYCDTCKVEEEESHPNSIFHQNYDLNSPKGFFKLYRWVEVQPWFEDLLYNYWSCPSPRRVFPHHFIHPERFADAIYKFLTGVFPSMYLVNKEKGRYDVK